ncbi:MAG: hypothetical protein FJ109_01615 [Deltaproteobacteria bacterium]|nr:hypothetical protein [Deltaproteobacteria bacterium]
MHLQGFHTRGTGILAVVIAALVSTAVACGPITDDDLKKWSQNEEGLKRIGELMQDEDQPLHIKTRAVQILVENGWSANIRGIVSKYANPQELASASAEKLVETLSAGNEELAQAARDGLFQLLGTMDEKHRIDTQKAITDWAFKGVAVDKTREEIWDLVSKKIALNQVRDLGSFAIPYTLIMIEKRVESESWNLLAWIEFVFSFYNPNEEDAEKKAVANKYKADALEALKRQHVALFKQMDSDKEAYFEPTDIVIVEKFDSPAAVLYLLDLARNPKVDPATQYDALVIAEKMFDDVVPEKDVNKHLDKVLSVIVNKLPEIRDSTGMGRLKQAQIFLDKSQIQGLKDVPLVIEKEIDGEKQTNWKAYLSVKGFHPAKFFYGVVSDFLDPLVEIQREALLKEFEERWQKEQAAAAPAGDKPADAAAAPAGDKPADAAAAPAPAAEKPDFLIDPAFMAELDKRVDAKVTPLVEDWIGSDLKIKRLMAVAGFKYLGTARSLELLQKVATDATDVAEYFGAGVTLGLVAQNAIKGISLAKEFEQLKVSALRDKLLSPDEIEKVRQRMLADLALTADELEKTYRDEIKKRQERYQQQKEKLAELMRKYQKAVRYICFTKIKDYPPYSDSAAMEKYIENTAISCQKEAEDKLTKKKLEFFGFTQDIYRSAVILGIMKREIERKFYIKAKARAYLKAAVEQGLLEAKVQKVLGKTKKWALDEADLRGVIDKFVGIALGMAKDDFNNSQGARGISEADLKEYRDFLELPEKYTLGAILAVSGKLDYSEEEAETKKWVSRSLIEDAANKDFAAATYFASDEKLVEFLMENYDDLWHLFQDIAVFGDAETQKRWGIPDETFTRYSALTAGIRATVDKLLALALADKKLDEAQIAALRDSYPLFEIVADAAIRQFDTVRKQKLEEEKAQAEAEAKKAAEEAAKSGEGKPAEGAAPAADKPAEGAAPATDKPAEGAAPAADKPAEGAAPAADKPAEGAAPAADKPAEGAAPAADKPAEPAK